MPLSRQIKFIRSGNKQLRVRFELRRSEPQRTRQVDVGHRFGAATIQGRRSEDLYENAVLGAFLFYTTIRLKIFKKKVKNYLQCSGMYGRIEKVWLRVDACI